MIEKERRQTVVNDGILIGCCDGPGLIAKCGGNYNEVQA
jgi:hypothetical protein